MTGTTGMAAGTRGAVLASDFIGQDVYTSGGEQVANVQDVIIDIPTGRVMYALVDLGGATGTRLVPVPVSAFSWDATNQYFITTVDRQTLESAPAFQGGTYPNFLTPGWDSDYSFYWQPILPTTRS